MTVFKKVLVIGGSRGLGRALVTHLPDHFENLRDVVTVSRKPVSIDNFPLNLKSISGDMSRIEDQGHVLRLIKTLEFDLVLYVAGGGPHGEYSVKEWKDHQWSLQVNLLSPMKLAHEWLRTRSLETVNKKFVIVGSHVAESQPDPLCSSYAAAKHGLVGFVSSLQDEVTPQSKKVWLFSPGYMDTEMLPSTARVRHNGTKMLSPDTAAQELLRWLKKDGPWHLVIN